MEYQLITMLILVITFTILFVYYYTKYTKIKGQIEGMRSNYGEIIRLSDSLNDKKRTILTLLADISNIENEISDLINEKSELLKEKNNIK